MSEGLRSINVMREYLTRLGEEETLFYNERSKYQPEDDEYKFLNELYREKRDKRLTHLLGSLNKSLETLGVNKKLNVPILPIEQQEDLQKQRLINHALQSTNNVGENNGN